MSVLRIFLLMFMVVIMFLMAVAPTSYESHRRASAWHCYYSAKLNHESAPTAETERAVELAKQQIEEAKRLDNRYLMTFEIVLLGILGLSVFAYICVGKKIQKSPASPAH